MRRIEDLPQKEIARRLQIAEATVEKHLVLVSARLPKPSTDTPHAPMIPPPKTHQVPGSPMANEPMPSREAAESAAAAWIARRDTVGMGRRGL